MRTKFIFLIFLLIIFKNSNADSFFDFFDNIFSSKNENESIWNLQKSPEIPISDLLNEKLNELISAGKYFKYSNQLSEGLYIIQYENNKIIIKILKNKQINSGKNGFSSKAISRKDILDEFVFSIKNIDGFWSMEIKNLEEYLDVKSIERIILKIVCELHL